MAHGSEDLKKKFLPKLVSGEWTGTMCLTEPQCGSDLAQVRTKAVPSADGTYKVTGKHIQRTKTMYLDVRPKCHVLFFIWSSLMYFGGSRRTSCGYPCNIY